MKNRKAFTLIELMIVVAIIAIIAAIAIPQLLRSRISSNEVSAVGTLTTLRTVQAQFQQAIVVDQNSNGMGEYGLFQELSGQEIPRGGTNPRTPGEFLSQEMGAVTDGISAKSGYMYLIYLPTDGVGPAVSEADIDLEATVDADADEQEVRWCCYAWPQSRTETGNRVFVVNQTGTVYASNNEAETQLYSGADALPTPEAAFIAVDGNPPIDNLGGRFPRLGQDEVGEDGGVWVPVS